MHLIFPESPIERRTPDELVREQYEMFRDAGYPVSLISIEALQEGEAKITFPPAELAHVLYRGWMLTPREYGEMERAVVKLGAQMLVSLDQYLSAHYLPNWYSKISEYTAETAVISQEEATPERLHALGWRGVFIKDFVKSLKTSVGSRITDPALLPVALREMRHFRGYIEGGICLRRIENYEAGSEVRYFIVDGVPSGPLEAIVIPEIVLAVARRIPSPFFSIDVARRDDGVLRVIEIGDGQVSDLVGWTPKRLLDVLKKKEPNR